MTLDQVAQFGLPLAAVVVAWLGVLVTAFTLPGTWLALAGASLAQWLHHEQFGTYMFSWWTLGVCLGLAVTAEIVEGVASAIGAAKAGGSKRAAIASIAGAILGAVLGTVLLPIPILGTIAGAAIGAGLAALLTEKHLGEKTWAQAARVGTGAAVGRLVATVAKVGFAIAIAITLTVDAVV